MGRKKEKSITRVLWAGGSSPIKIISIDGKEKIQFEAIAVYGFKDRLEIQILGGDKIVIPEPLYSTLSLCFRSMMK